MARKQLSYEDRIQIEKLYKTTSFSGIARILNRSVSAIAREIEKGKCYQRIEEGLYTFEYAYDANMAQYCYEVNKKQSAKITSIEKSDFKSFLIELQSQFRNSKMTLLECFRYVKKHNPKLRSPKSVRTVKKYIEENLIEITIEDVKNREFQKRKEKIMQKLTNELKEERNKIYE